MNPNGFNLKGFNPDGVNLSGFNRDGRTGTALGLRDHSGVMPLSLRCAAGA
jgi:hypothetical protein